ncbi:MAG: cytochrome c-type biosis protein CcmE [Solirubrobacteraceae bacterium]|jgi:cytochrome c-type biogenesis protein CcmE|nr:cytochrome c-type biosis protein CcmE [Solirubrobacteraceae bacterium]
MQTLRCADRHRSLRIPVACSAGSSGILKPPMNPARKRRIRLVVAVSAALLLASALIYTSFSASSEAVTPSRLASNAATGRAYQLTGKVVDGSVRDIAGGKTFRVRDRNGTISVPVRYVGAVPDPFRDGREVIVTVRKEGATFVGERDSLVTKCPSKFSDKQPSQPV